MARIILHADKSELWKTTTAEAISWNSAEPGYRTIILSTDANHSIADSIDISPGNGLQHIAPNLWRRTKFDVKLR